MASSGFQADVRALQKVLASRHLVKMLEVFVNPLSLQSVWYGACRMFCIFVQCASPVCAI